MAARTPKEVIEDHLYQANDGDIETDLKKNYAQDSVLLTGFGTFRGHQGVRQANEILNKQLPVDDAAESLRSHLWWRLLAGAIEASMFGASSAKISNLTP